MNNSNRAEDFLLKNQYGVLAVTLPSGMPHASMMHFAVGIDPLFDIYFGTGAGTRKASALVRGEAQASLVVGPGDTWQTLQMDGILRQLSDPKEIEVARMALYAKYPGDQSQEKANTIFLHFKPTWYRYSDFATTPPLILPWGELETKEGISNPD